MTKPLLSVIIPVYNGEKYLAEAIESILAQTYRTVEIIVVDDGSTDRSAMVAKRFLDNVQYLYQSNSGCGAARNSGIKKSDGTFLAFLDADDLWVEDKLSLQMEVLESDPCLDMLFGNVEHFYSPDLDQSMREKLLCPSGKMPGYHAGTMLIRRESFLRVGMFNPDLQCGEFLDWYSRAKEMGYRERLLQDVLMKRRIHSSNLGIVKRNTRSDNNQVDMIRALKASLDRRRKEGTQI